MRRGAGELPRRATTPHELPGYVLGALDELRARCVEIDPDVSQLIGPAAAQAVWTRAAAMRNECRYLSA